MTDDIITFENMTYATTNELAGVQFRLTVFGRGDEVVTILGYNREQFRYLAQRKDKSMMMIARNALEECERIPTTNP